VLAPHGPRPPQGPRLPLARGLQAPGDAPAQGAGLLVRDEPLPVLAPGAAQPRGQGILAVHGGGLPAGGLGPRPSGPHSSLATTSFSAAVSTGSA